ncbi:ras-like protein family member 12 isoform X2 [Meles meles]|uniref:ras-like protein family member 12 isoform X2 n=1 Tax=Meles meles TaxID=9662 RepID=UPI001E69CC6F|nr:ras-like protein family member 12 isoform X2 [Meles meles]
MSSVFGKPRAGSGPQSAPLEVNLAILGRRGAGKSALTVKFLTRRFISEYDPNLEDTYSSEETVDHQPVHLRVMDTADPDTPRNCERYLNWAHAFLVVYSMDSRRSFEDSSSYLELLALHAKETQRSSPALLLGNKLDMAQYRWNGVQRGQRCTYFGPDLSLLILGSVFFLSHPHLYPPQPPTKYFRKFLTIFLLLGACFSKPAPHTSCVSKTLVRTHYASAQAPLVAPHCPCP